MYVSLNQIVYTDYGNFIEPPRRASCHYRRYDHTRPRHSECMPKYSYPELSQTLRERLTNQLYFGYFASVRVQGF